MMPAALEVRFISGAGDRGPAPRAACVKVWPPLSSHCPFSIPAPASCGDCTGRPSALELRGRSTGTELVIARALGAEWLDDYVSTWRHVRLEIGGGDLLAAGVPEGPALGHGLREALRAKLDGEVEGREQELAAALAVASGG